MNLAKRVGASRALFAALLVPLIASVVIEHRRKLLRHWFFGFFILCAIYRSFGGSLFVGTTQDNLILAVFLHYFLHWYGRWAWLLLTPVVVGLLDLGEHADAGNGALVVLLVYAVLWFAKKDFKKWVGIYFVACAIAVVSILNIHIDNFNPVIQRLELWDQFISYWQTYANSWIGFGPGSFEWLSTGKQFKWHWIWMHSDWTQFLFETGWIGLIAAVSYYLFLLTRNVADYKRLTLVGLGVGMLVYSPIQFSVIQFLTVLMWTEETNERETFRLEDWPGSPNHHT